MLRFALSCAYNGAAFLGWQSQVKGRTVQDTLQRALGTLLKAPIEIVGCGRTDTGVHAKEYIAHFDLQAMTIDHNPLADDFVYHLNAILPPDLAVNWIKQMPAAFHARFDAIKRSYEYFMHGYKSPFLLTSSYHFKQFHLLKLEKLNEAAALLLQYKEFYPFCLADSGVDNYRVKLDQAIWSEILSGQIKFTISANRFLRGMVRLVAGMCVQVAIDQMKLSDVKLALDQQTRLPKSLSLPAHALFLTKIEYENRR